jgi:F-type H+-transporting ATPase subunit epsilon
MRLSILLPYGVFLEALPVAKIVLDTAQGSMGLLPRRLDFVAGVVPGLLVYTTEAGSESFVALDEGTVVKVGADVWVTVREAFAGTDLGLLHQRIGREFTVRSERDKEVRLVMGRLEAGLLRRYAEFHRG